MSDAIVSIRNVTKQFAGTVTAPGVSCPATKSNDSIVSAAAGAEIHARGCATAVGAGHTSPTVQSRACSVRPTG